MEKKYELTGTTTWLGRTLHRIRAVRDIVDTYGKILVKKGELGGWIENESNLSHEGACWVFDNSRVYDKGGVYDNGKVYDNGEVYGNGKVRGYGEVRDNGKVFFNGEVCGCGKVYDNGMVFGNGIVYGKGMVRDNGKVYDNGEVYGNGKVRGYGEVYGNGMVCGKGMVYKIGKVYGFSKVSGNALITSETDIISVYPIGSRSDCTTFFRNADGGISVTCGCFTGTIEEFEKAVEATHGCDFYNNQYKAAINLAKMSLLRNE